MAGVSDKSLVTLTGFPAGVNNRTPEQDLPRNDDGDIVAAREIVNFDLVGGRGKPRLRPGYTERFAGRCHSPAGIRGQRDLLLAVVDGDLNAYRIGSGLSFDRTIRAGVGPLYLTYAQVHEDLYWSSPTALRRIRGDDLADLPGWIDCPGTPQVDAYASGDLPAGAYRVAMTWLDADGRESGAMGVAEVVLASGQGIRVHAIPPAPEGAATARIYCSPPDGEELYAALDLAPGVTQTLLDASHVRESKRVLETLWHQPMPPCQILRYWNGRLVGADGNVLRWSPALRIGLTANDAWMRFGERITMIEPLGEGEEAAGVWIADHKNTYWLAGGAPDAFLRLIRRDAAVAPGTSMTVPGKHLGLDTAQDVAFWLGTDGVFCAGLPSGQLVPLTENQLALPEGEAGASLFRASNGLFQLVTSFISRGGNGMAVADRPSATVTTHP